jgi:hypothetical protein
VIVSDKTQFVQHPVTGKWLDNNDGIALIDVDMDYKAADDDLEVGERLREQSLKGERELFALLKEAQALIAELGRGLERAEGKRSARPSLWMISAIVQILDLVLDPKKADEVIGDLLEQYPRRLSISGAHAKRWLVVQAAWIVFDRALDVIRQVAAARAGR